MIETDQAYDRWEAVGRGHVFKAKLMLDRPKLGKNNQGIAAGNGYDADGILLRFLMGSDGKYHPSNFSLTAKGGPIGPFRYILAYDTAAGAPARYWDNGKEDIIRDGETLWVEPNE